MEVARYRALTPPLTMSLLKFVLVEMEVARYRALTHFSSLLHYSLSSVEMEVARYRALTRENALPRYILAISRNGGCPIQGIDTMLVLVYQDKF